MHTLFKLPDLHRLSRINMSMFKNAVDISFDGRRLPSTIDSLSTHAENVASAMMNAARAYFEDLQMQKEGMFVREINVPTNKSTSSLHDELFPDSHSTEAEFVSLTFKQYMEINEDILPDIFYHFPTGKVPLYFFKPGDDDVIPSISADDYHRRGLIPAHPVHLLTACINDPSFMLKWTACGGAIMTHELNESNEICCSFRLLASTSEVHQNLQGCDFPDKEISKLFVGIKAS